MRHLRHPSRSMVVAVLCGIGAAVIVCIALGDSAGWAVKVPIALVGGATIGLIGAGYAELGRENEED